jgi:hypothetical protein
MANTTEKRVTKPAGKIGLNTLISWGASVVIIGLTFKLLHWEWGDWLIGLGLLTEAGLFFILGFSHMNKAEEEDVVVEKTVAPDNSRLDDLLHSSINPHTIERIGKGFEQFTKTVEAVNQASGYAQVSQAMIDEVESATREIREFRKNLSELSSVYKAQLDSFRKN